MGDDKFSSILTLAKKEFMDNVRSKWILLLTAAFIGFILLVAVYQGYVQDSASFEDIIQYALSLVSMFFSLIAIMLGYNAITTEIESSSIGLLLTSKLDRKDILVGKFLGLASVLAFSIVVGLGLGGIINGISNGFDGGWNYLGFIFFSLMFSLAFLSISMMMSSLFKKNSRALAGGIFVWIFFNIIWSLVLTGIMVASGVDFNGITSLSDYPKWYFIAGLGNPENILSYSTTTLLNDGTTYLPDILRLELLTGSQLVWIIAPLLVAFLVFSRKDI